MKKVETKAAKATQVPATAKSKKTAKVATATVSAKGKTTMSYKGLQTALKSIKEEGLKLNAQIRNISALLATAAADNEIKAIADLYGITPNIGGEALKAARNKITASVVFYTTSESGGIWPVVGRNVKDAKGNVIAVAVKPTTWINAMRLHLNRWRKGLDSKHVQLECKDYSIEDYKEATK